MWRMGLLVHGRIEPRGMLPIGIYWVVIRRPAHVLHRNLLSRNSCGRRLVRM
jgi:hypothetical protein